MSNTDLIQQFNNTLKKKLESTLTEKSALRKWDKLRNTIYSTALDTFGKKTSKTCDWFDSKATVMMPAIEDKRSAHLQYINLPYSKNLQALEDARKKVQQTARRCANEFWVELSQKKINMLQTQEIFAECMTASKKLSDQSRERPLLQNQPMK